MVFRTEGVLVTTEGKPDGIRVLERFGVVASFALATTGRGKDLLVGLKDLFSGSWKGYEKDIGKTISDCLNEIIADVRRLGGNAVVGLSVQIVPIFVERTKMFQVFVYGTACRAAFNGKGEVNDGNV